MTNTKETFDKFISNQQTLAETLKENHAKGNGII